MGGKTSTSTQTSELPPDIVAAYDKLLAQAQPIADKAYQPYTGGVGGSGFQQNQLTGFDSIAGLKGASDSDFTSAAHNYATSAAPTYSDVNNYMNPYIQNVVSAATANMAEQNGEQQQGVIGNAAALGALGGNRVGVAQSELSRQQALANNQNISNILEQGYSGAISADQADKTLQQQAASGQTTLGQTAMQTDLAQAAAQVGAGTQQQSWDYQQYQNALSYPFQSTSWLANIVEGLGAGRGTTTTTQPSGNTASSVLGGVLGVASLFNKGGVAHPAAKAPAAVRPRYATGGIIPYMDPSGIIAANNNQPGADNDNGYVPQAQAASGAIGPPHAGGLQQQPDQGQQMLQTGIDAEEKSLKKQFPNGILAGRPAPMQGPTLSGAPLGGGGSSFMSKLGGLFGFAGGGVARRGYDVGGGVDYPVGDIGGLSTDDMVSLLGPTPAPYSDAPVRYPTIAQDQNSMYADEIQRAAKGPAGMTPADLTAKLGPVPAPAGVAPPQSAGVAPDVAVPPLAAPVNVASNPVPPPGVFAHGPVAGVAPAPQQAVASRPPVVRSSSQPVYDGFMNTVRSVVKNPYGLAAIAATGIHESGFSANNASRTWADPSKTDPNARAGGILSWAGPRLTRLQAANGGTNGTPQQQAAFFIQENPALIKALNNAKSPQEAQQIMNGAWRFAGWDKPGGEAQARINQAVALAPQFLGTTTPADSGTAPAWADTAVATRSAPTGVDTATTGSTARPSGGVLGGSGTVDGAPAPTHMGGILGNVGNFFSGKGGHLLNLSDDQRMALLSAGLGMMAGNSPHFAQNVGTGGLKGIETWQAQQKQNRENALASSEINTRSADVGIRGQQLAIDAGRAGAEIKLNTAEASHANMETSTMRWESTNTPAGMLIRDRTNPLATPRLVSWQDIQQNGLPPEVTSNEQIGAGASGGQGANAPAATARPATAPNNAPVTVAPTQPVAGPITSTAVPAHIPVDGRVMSPASQPIAMREAEDAISGARTSAIAAQNSNLKLDELDRNLSQIPATGFGAQGPGFGKRLQFMKDINFIAPGAFDPNVIAAGENAGKLNNSLGFDASRVLGSQEAASITERAIANNPGPENSKRGAEIIANTMRAANLRATDYYTFLQRWEGVTGGSVKGADEEFNRKNPPELYALMTYVPLQAIRDLRADPSGARDFDEAFGNGKNVSQYVLAGKD